MTLRRILEPRSIAIIGASRHREKIGHTIIENIQRSGFRGTIYPVNPKAKTVLGLKCYPDVSMIKKNIDCALIVIPAHGVVQALEACGKKGISFAIIISSGFKETGKEGKRLEDQVVQIAKKYSIRVLGPNCLGVINTSTRINASFSGEYPNPGNISFISQSGAVAVGLIDWALQTHVGLNALVSLGNACDITECDVLEYLEHDTDTDVIGLYIEHISNVPRFMTLVSRISLKKPVVLIKAGKSSAAQHAVMSHTGSLASSAAVTSTIFSQSGAIEVDDLEDLFNVLQIFSTKKRHPSPEVAIVTNAGGPGIISVDEIAQTTLNLASFDSQLQRSLRAVLPSAAAVGNPIDLMGDADVKRYRSVLSILLTQPKIGTICVIVTPQTVTPIEDIARLCISLQKKTNKHIIVCYIGGKKVAAARHVLAQHHVSQFSFTYDALRALSLSMKFYEKHDIFDASVPRYSHVNASAPSMMAYVDVQRLLKNNDFPISLGTIIRSEAEIDSITSYPVAAKILSTQIIHKKDAGGIHLGIQNKSELVKVYREFIHKFGSKKLEGILVQKMIPEGLELIMGVKRDPAAGPIVMVGIGGSYTELIHDVVMHIGSMTMSQADTLLQGLRSYDKIISKYDTVFIRKVLVQLSRFALKNPQIDQLDFNPITVYAKGGNIIDARISTTT